MQQKLSKSIPVFIQIILDIIQKYPDVVNWTESGTQFSILNTQLFIHETLPMFFKHEKFESFVRQLNMYGFHKVCRNKNSVNFKNQFFVRDRQDQYWMIKRKKKQIAELKLQMLDRQQKFKELVTKKYIHQNPRISQLLQELIQFKDNSMQRIEHLKKNLDELGREVNERKTKVIKPLIAKTKEVISQTRHLSHQVNKQLQNLEKQIQEECTDQIAAPQKIVLKQNIPRSYNSFTNILDLKPHKETNYQIGTHQFLTGTQGISSFSSFDLLA